MPENIDFKFKQMRHVGQLTHKCLKRVQEKSHEFIGKTTDHIEEIVHEFAKEHKLKCATQGYKGFPGDCCISLNEMACHGIPSPTKKMEEGDLVSVDVTFINEAGYYGDSCVTFPLGKPSKKHEELLDIAQEAMWRGIHVCKPGIKVKEIGEAIETFVAKHKMTVLKEWCGHGIGKYFHGFPLIPHTVDISIPDSDFILEPGITFTIEPIITLGKNKTKVCKDNWGIVTKDKHWTAQFEHTLGITNDGNEVFTA